MRAECGGMVTRRALLLAGAAGLVLPAAGCSAPAPARPAGAAAAARLAELERRFGARLGVYARDTGRGTVLTYHADQRFPMCSTFKVLATAAVLHRYDRAELGQLVRYGRADLVPPSPVSTAHLGTGLTLRQLGQAAVSDSDSTAANLLLARLGGPAAVTRYARTLGDQVTRLDRTEPTVNQARPGDDQDTTSPRAIGGDYMTLLFGAALPRADRALLTRWLVGGTTGAGRIRAAVPRGWTVGDKTGTGQYGTDNDVGVLWPPGRAPIVLAVLSTRASPGAAPSDALIAQATRVALAAL